MWYVVQFYGFISCLVVYEAGRKVVYGAGMGGGGSTVGAEGVTREREKN